MPRALRTCLAGVIAGVLPVLLSACYRTASVDAPGGCLRPRTEKGWTEPAFPLPRALHEYERVLALHGSGKAEAAVELAGRLVARPLRLAPDYALTEERYHAAYYNKTQMSALTILGRVCKSNSDYAARLGRKGVHTEAVRVLAVNVLLARQMIHLQPADVTPVINGNAYWRLAWTAIGRELSATAQGGLRDASRGCAERSGRFSEIHLAAHLKDQRRDLAVIQSAASRKPESTRARMMTEFRRTELAKVRGLVKVWDVQVGGPCQAVIVSLSGIQ